MRARLWALKDFILIRQQFPPSFLFRFSTKRLLMLNETHVLFQKGNINKFLLLNASNCQRQVRLSSQEGWSALEAFDKKNSLTCRADLSLKGELIKINGHLRILFLSLSVSHCSRNVLFSVSISEHLRGNMNIEFWWNSCTTTNLVDLCLFLG